MIPTRSSIQIRSHCHKYLDQIKKDFQTEDPMECVLKGMCDASPLYQFKSPEVAPLVKIKMDDASTHLNMASYGTCFDRGQETSTKNSSFGRSSCEAEYISTNMEKLKKRDFKYVQKNTENTIKKSFSSSISREKRFSKNKNSEKLVGAEEAFYRTIQPMNSPNFDTLEVNQDCPAKSQNQESRKASDLSSYVKNGAHVLMLGKRKLIIQADRIESVIPYQQKKLQGGGNMFIPQGLCEIQIIPMNKIKENICQDMNSKKVSQNFNRASIQGCPSQSDATQIGCNTTNLNQRRTESHKSTNSPNLPQGMEFLKQIFCLSVLEQD
ncbi:unnamed protein product [Moneuplotes crassus]|uniref:HTH myb-type domain-containing protein n=1 Tax=Euplotes crassus TaxID=5936 RepID=A0AAD1XFV1_EUPCR|nr:unnamed protein product [Moneuplotes crassus]